MLSEFEAKQISDWLSNTENIRSLSSEAQMKLAQANKEIQEAQFQLERASQKVKKYRNERDDGTAENYISF